MADIVVSKPSQSVDNEGCTVTSNTQIDGQEIQINYKVSRGPVSSTSDAFLTASLYPAMLTGGDLKIEGSVSAKLLRATDSIQDIITSWFPEYKSIAIESETSPGTEVSDNRGVGVFFSGGIDSFYTLLKQRDEITNLIFIHGYDIQLDKHSFRERAFKSVQDVAAGFGKVLIEVETNLARSLEEISPRFIPAGGDAHGAVLASIALLLSPQLRKVYIPSTYTYGNLSPWGSHVLSDPLWSTEDVEIVHDGCEATRVHKAALVAQSEVALKNLRVCLFKPEEGLNCKKCEKCLRSMANLRAVGALERCTTLKQQIDLEALARVEISSEVKYECYRETLRNVEMSGHDPELEEALRACIKNYEYGKLTKELDEVMIPFFESSAGRKMLASRRNTFFKYLWNAHPGWMTREMLKENLKRADRKYLGGLLARFRNGQ